MRADVKRLELARIRVCNRCRRGVAELRGADGESLNVPLDAIRTRQLSGDGRKEDLPSVADLLVAEVAGERLTLGEVVFDVSDDRLRALLSLARGDEHEVVECTAEEGVALAVRGRLKIYVTDDALAHRNAPLAKPEPESGPDTIH
jgi:hypothetical protein